MNATLNLSKLNPNQREAILHENGPLLILAGAGSGKTTTMAHRIAHLLAERHVSPTAILGLSFTNKAAHELKDRVRSLVSKINDRHSTRGLTISTFHSLCVRILRSHGSHLGFQTNFTILDENDRKDLLRQILRNIRIDDRKFDLDRILFEIGQAKSRLMKAEEAEQFFLQGGKLPSDYAIATASSFGRYQQQLRLLNAMDFDDLLYHGVQLLEDHEEVRKHYNYRFRHILVDEYQDTNPTQFRLLSLLTQEHQNICVVGDDDQSIYSWRGADPTHILEFNRHYPTARTITLDQNYRSTSSILEAANAVIANNTKRHAKRLWSDRGQGSPLLEVITEDDRGEAEYVAREIFTHSNEQNRPWKDFAILYRSNSQSRVFEEALRRHQIPYTIVGGMSFLDRKEVKDVLSYWRLIVNPKDDTSLRRILNWPARGIGKSSAETLFTYAFEKHLPILEAIPKILSENVKENLIQSKSAIALERFAHLIQHLQQELSEIQPTSESLAQWGRSCLEKIGVKKAIEDESDDPVQFARKWENVEELIHSLGQVEKEELEENASNPVLIVQEFLHRMTLEAQSQEEDADDASKKDKEANQVTLLTLHGAKGLEYPVVFLVGMEEGLLPHRRTIEEAIDFSEERRLCYVGITRAKDHLTLTRARNRIRYGKPVPRYRSRFMNEIPPDYLTMRDESHGPDHTDTQEARQAHEEKVLNHLSAIKALLEKN